MDKPEPENKGAGRPEKRPTKAQYKQVEIRVAAGWPHSQIADDLGVTEPTLRKHYAEQLKLGWKKSSGRLLDLYNQQAEGGSVAAMKRLDEIFQRNNPNFNPDAKETGADEAAEKPQGYQSKKAARIKDAQSVGDNDPVWGNDLAAPGVKPALQ